MISVTWLARPSPGVPEAVLLPKTTLKAQPRLLDGRELHGVAFARSLVLLAPESELPWTVDASYFARSSLAPSLYLPTGQQPSVPEELLERVVRLLSDQDGGPFLVCPREWIGLDSKVLSLRAAAPIDAQELERWLSLR